MSEVYDAFTEGVAYGGMRTRNDVRILLCYILKSLDGRVLIFAAGYPAPKTELDSNLIHYRRIEIIGTYNCGLKEFEIAAQLLNTGAVDVKPMCEPETFPLDRIQDAFAAAATPGKFRVHVEIPE